MDNVLLYNKNLSEVLREMGIGRATVPKVLVSVCLESFSESIYRRMKSLKIKFPITTQEHVSCCCK